MHTTHSRAGLAMQSDGSGNFLNPMAGMNVSRSLSCSQLMPQHSNNSWMPNNHHKAKEDGDNSPRFLRVT